MAIEYDPNGTGNSGLVSKPSEGGAFNNEASGEYATARSAANDALASANSAATSATESADSATASADSATAAATSETNAANSETNSSGSAEAAELAQSLAEQAQAAAELAETNSETAQGLSENARDDSQTAQSLSEDARDASIVAQGLSEDAKDASIVAQGLSEDAKDASIVAQGLSEDAKDASVLAQGLSEDARDASVLAQGLSEDARDASITAQGLAETAQGLSEDARDASIVAQAASEAAQAATESLFDQFGDQYLGSKSSDPIVDNDGDPLTDGDVYFNTTDNVLKFYTGTAWVAPEDVATTAAANALSSEQAAALSESAAALSQSAAALSETNAGSSETAAGNFATLSEYSAIDAATSETNAATSETNAASSAAAALVSESNASASETASASSESAAATSASLASLFANNAENSAVNASTSETNASTSETNAADSATAAAASETAASTSETNSAASETAALASQTAAAASETASATSESNASASATASANSATESSISASAAATSETNAATSESNAATSETNAATSETNAAASEAAALASENAAATSETNAAASELSASTSANESATSASEALTSETNAATSETNAATSESNAATSETNAAASESASATSATNASASATASANSATAASQSASAASTSETNAATSETNAAISETNAATSETNAATSETNAATSETAAQAAQILAETAQTAAELAESNAETAQGLAETAQSLAETAQAGAETAETNAQTAQTAAEAAQAATEAVYDSFDDRYLGAKASEPTLDNDGNVLLTGALYFNSTQNLMKIYDGATWLDAYASLSGALLSTQNLSDLDDVAISRSNLGLGTAATTDSTAYATAAQGATADSAIQPNDDAQLNSLEIGDFTNHAGAKLSWNAVDGTVDLAYDGVSLQLGQEQHVYGKAVGAISNGDPVMFAGAQGDHILVTRADVNTVGFKSEYFLGLATDDIANNAYGYITTFGSVRGLDTSGFNEGDLLYVSTDSPAVLTSTIPAPPLHSILTAAVTRSHAAEGTVFVRPTLGKDLYDLCDVNFGDGDPSDGNLIAYDATNGYWNQTGSPTLDTVTLRPDEDLAHSEGLLYYNNEYKTLTMYNDVQDISLQIGLEEWVRVYNGTGSTILNGTPCRPVGAQGENQSVAPAIATSAGGSRVLGVATHDIPTGTTGILTVRGLVSGIDTSSLNAGQPVFLNETGGLQNTAPTYPYYPTQIGGCIVSDATNGYIYVSPNYDTLPQLRVTGNQHVDGNLTIEGNLTIQGTQTIANEANLSISDSFIYLNSGDTIGAANTTFSGTGLDDMYFSNHYEGTTTETYYVRIDGVGTGTGGVDTFEWSKDNFTTTEATGVDLAEEVLLDNNLCAHFEANTGHTSGDSWSGTAAPVNVDTGWFTNYNTGTTGIGYTHAGVYLDATDQKFKFIEAYGPEPSGNIDTEDASFTLGTLVADTFEGTATDSDKLNNQLPSYYLDYTNLTNKPTIGDGTVTVSAGDGLGTGGSFDLNDTTNSTVTLTNTDKGSSQNIFKSFEVSGQNTVFADSNTDSLEFVAGDNVTLTTDDTNNTITIQSSYVDTVYTHPTYAGDDISVDTGALSGATVISDLDFNVTTDSLGHVTDANATVSTRNLTLSNLGFTGNPDANKYVHPTYNGDDLSADTGVLSGATVISDLDFNVTTDSLGHVTDANASVATRNLTLADLGFTGDSNATNFVHPTHPGDDINLDTGALSGATVISDLDFNVTTDTLGHVTDANATVSTRNLTASDIGAQPAGNYVKVAGDTMTGTLDFGSITGRAITITADTGLDGADASIYLGNDPSQYGFDITYEGTGSGNTNAFVITSTNSGSPKELLRSNQDGIVNLPQSGAKVAGNTIFHDGYHPNADKWTTARTLSLTGDVTGSTTWDGSGNASITATVANDSHSHSNYITSNAADTATGRVQFSANEANNWDTIATSSGSQGSLEVYNNGSGNDAFMCFHAGGDYALYFGLDADSNDLAVGGWSMGAVKHKVWHAGNDGSGSGLDADLLDGVQLSAITHSGDSVALTGDVTGSATVASNGSISISTTVLNDSHTHDSLYPRIVSNRLYFGGGLVALDALNSTYLYTSFLDGSSSFSNGGIGLQTAQNITHDGNNTALRVYDRRDLPLVSDDYSHFKVERQGEATPILDVYTQRFYNAFFGANDTIVAKLDGNKIFHEGYHPNADKWTTARTLSLTGDVTGSVSWDGSGNASITAAVVNDSHNHDHSDGSFTVNGNLSVTGTIVETSDKRLKSDIEKIDNALEKVSNLSGYTYYKEGVEEKLTGVIAQEVQAVLPEAVQESDEGYLSVSYGNMVGLLIESIKEQQGQIDDLKEQLAELKASK